MFDNMGPPNRVALSDKRVNYVIHIMDINIVIRTFLIKGNRAYFQVGGAVVYDSDPESEYQETLDKGRALINALNTAEPK